MAAAWLRLRHPLRACHVNNQLLACHGGGLSQITAMVFNNGLALRWCREATGSLISLSATRAAFLAPSQQMR